MGLYSQGQALKPGGTITTFLLVITAVLAQGQPPSRTPRNAPQKQAGIPLKKARPDAGDPLAKVGIIATKPEPGTFHFNFRLRSFDGTPLASSYYPSKLSSSAPVVMLVHESGRSRKDFEEPVLELKGQGLAEHLQGLGYVVLSTDLRWQGQNPRRPLSKDERPKLLEDLQAGYFFLVDRHNRGDLNIAKLGVLGLGDGANLVAAWALQPGAATTTRARASELSALLFVSPRPQGSGYVFEHVVASVAERVPLLLLAGERDNGAKDAVQAAVPFAQRTRLSKVQVFPSSLTGYRMLRLEPKVTSAIIHFLDTTLKNRPVEWEPEYNLTPVTFGDIELVLNTKATPVRNDQVKEKVQQAKPGAELGKLKAGGANNAKEAKGNGQIPRENTLPPPPVPEKSE
jgi:hypothetical protein